MRFSLIPLVSVLSSFHLANNIPEKSLEVERDRNRELLERIFKRVDKKIEKVASKIDEKMSTIRIPDSEEKQTRQKPISFLFQNEDSMMISLPELLSGSSQSCMFPSFSGQLIE